MAGSEIPNYHKTMTPTELEAYDAMMADRDKWKRIAEYRTLEIERHKDVNRRLMEDVETRRENNFGLNRRNVRLTAALEKIAANPGWMDDEFGFMSGHIARGALDSQNAQGMAAAACASKNHQSASSPSP